jgi:hypothetical protein
MASIDFMFIFQTAGCHPETHRAEITWPKGKTTVIGVDSVDEACAVAVAAAKTGEADFIELCGAFEEDGCRAVIAAVDGKLPVGYVAYFRRSRSSTGSSRRRQAPPGGACAAAPSCDIGRDGRPR